MITRSLKKKSLKLLSNGHHLVQIDSIFETLHPDTLEPKIAIRFVNAAGFITIWMDISESNIHKLSLIGYLGGLQEGYEWILNDFIGLKLTIQVSNNKVIKIQHESTESHT